MYKTVEVRWFREGSLPAEVKSWFAVCPGKADGWESRVDSYLSLNSGNIGIKLREGRLEIKQRSQKIGYLQFNKRMAGLVERWWKIGTDLSQLPTKDEPLFNDLSGWKAVRKERNLKLYRSEDFGTDNTRLSPGDRPSIRENDLELGCTLEIAGIHFMGQDWWSLAFEAFGEPGAAYSLLLNVIKPLTYNQQSPKLKTSESYSYPRWLAILASA